MVNTSSRLPALDGLKGIFAIPVVVWYETIEKRLAPFAFSRLKRALIPLSEPPQN